MVEVPPLAEFVRGQELPEIFCLQFQLNNRQAPVTFIGTMHRVWFRPRFLKPLYWILHKLGIMISTTGENVPIELVIRPEITTNGIPQLNWYRTFYFADKHGNERIQQFNTQSSYDPRQGVLMDKIGPLGFLRFQLELSYQDDVLNVMNQRLGFASPFGVLWLPRWLSRLLAGSGGVRQHVDPDDPNRFHMVMELKHPLLGRFFGYEGTIDHID